MDTESPKDGAYNHVDYSADIAKRRAMREAAADPSQSPLAGELARAMARIDALERSLANAQGHGGIKVNWPVISFEGSQAKKETASGDLIFDGWENGVLYAFTINATRLEAE